MNKDNNSPDYFKTVFGTRLPIIAGGLMWLSDAEYAAAAANAGILGFITAASFPNDADLIDEIRKCRDLSCGRPFGVNVSMLPNKVSEKKFADTFKLIADQGVEIVETSGRNPETYLPILKKAGVKVIHKVPTVKYANE